VFEITEGQRHDSRPASGLIQRAMSRRLLADKAYDSDTFRACLNDQSGQAIIPSNGSRAQKLALDKELYKARSEIECTFSLLKQARRFATRYEKTLRNYVAWSPSGVRCFGCGSELILTALGQLDQHRHNANNHGFAGPVSALFE
jgi:transposase